MQLWRVGNLPSTGITSTTITILLAAISVGGAKQRFVATRLLTTRTFLFPFRRSEEHQRILDWKIDCIGRADRQPCCFASRHPRISLGFWSGLAGPCARRGITYFAANNGHFEQFFVTKSGLAATSPSFPPRSSTAMTGTASHRRSPRNAPAAQSSSSADRESPDPNPKAAVTKRKRSPSSGKPKKQPKTKTVDTENSPSAEENGETSTKQARRKPPKEDNTKVKKKVDHQVITERDALPKLWDGAKAMETQGSYTFKAVSWNVAGLRALVRNHPSALSDLVQEHRPDLLCLQEIKLQENHIDDPKLGISELLVEEGYDAHYSCSTEKKGYSGTAVFVRRRKKNKSRDEEKQGQPTSDSKGADAKASKKQAKLSAFFTKPEKSDEAIDPENGEPEECTTGDMDATDLIPTKVSFQLGKEKHDGEGRVVLLDYPLFTVANLYVPNSGQKLARLSYRTEEWDSDLLMFMQQKEKDRGLPVVWLGDLNVAHTDMDVWNDGAKHLAKSAGTTPEERASFQKQLDAGYIDCFRQLHPSAKAQYTYWSQRAGNREPNKGLRLDYFICSKELFENSESEANEEPTTPKRVYVRDSYILPDIVGSDHCPIVLEMEIKQ